MKKTKNQIFIQGRHILFLLPPLRLINLQISYNFNEFQIKKIKLKYFFAKNFLTSNILYSDSSRQKIEFDSSQVKKN